MKIFFTSVFIIALFSTINGQSQLRQELENDFSEINTLLAEASEFAYDCSQQALFAEKMNEAFMYYDERIIYYSNLDEDSSGFKENQTSKSDFLKFLEDNLYGAMTDIKTKANRYGMLCELLVNEDEIQLVISVYNDYSTLIGYYSDLSNSINNQLRSLEQEVIYIDEISCEYLYSVAANCDDIDVSINTYMSYIDTANKQFYDLPEKLQNLKINYNHKKVNDSKDDTSAKKVWKDIERSVNAKQGDDYLFFDKFKGFRTNLSFDENMSLVNNRVQYNEINTDKLRNFIEKVLKHKECN